MTYRSNSTFDQHPGYHSNDSPFSSYSSGDLSSGYRKEEEDRNRNSEKEKTEFERHIDEQAKPKYDKKDDPNHNLQFRAAMEVSNEMRENSDNSFGNTGNIETAQKEKTKNSIEEAILAAINPEQKARHL